jgi:GNAT superfamily N-acetyltransferase
LIERAALLVTSDPDGDPSVIDSSFDPHRARYFVNWWRNGDFGVVAEERGVFVGAAWCRRFDRGELEHAAMTPGAHEVAVAVESERRRSGVGAVLVSSVLDAAAQHQLVGLELTVGAHRDWLVRFYECAGFRVFALSGRHVLMRAPLGAE